jgi:hypothetical protein
MQFKRTRVEAVPLHTQSEQSSHTHKKKKQREASQICREIQSRREEYEERC